MRIDTTNIKKMLDNMWIGAPDKVPDLLKYYENNMAFRVKKYVDIDFKARTQLKFKSNNSARFVARGISVQKSDGITGASVGAMMYNKDRKGYGRLMVERLYFGGNLKQVNAGGKYRKELYVGKQKLPEDAGSRSMRVPRRARKLPRKEMFKISLYLIRKKRKKYLFTDNAIFEVHPFIGIKSYMGPIKPKGSIPKTRSVDWMSGPVSKAIEDRDELFQKTIFFVLYELDEKKRIAKERREANKIKAQFRKLVAEENANIPADRATPLPATKFIKPPFLGVKRTPESEKAYKNRMKNLRARERRAKNKAENQAKLPKVNRKKKKS